MHLVAANASRAIAARVEVAAKNLGVCAMDLVDGVLVNGRGVLDAKGRNRHVDRRREEWCDIVRRRIRRRDNDLGFCVDSQNINGNADDDTPDVGEALAEFALARRDGGGCSEREVVVAFLV